MKINDTEKCTQNRDESKDDNKHLNVYLRIKAGVEHYQELYEIQTPNVFVSKTIHSSHSTKSNNEENSIRKKYEFTKIFGQEVTQGGIFEEIMKPKLKKFIDGINCTLMTYGVSGSGKTYTVVGSKQDPGVLPRSLLYLFKLLNVDSKPQFKPYSHGGIVKLRSKEILKELKMKQDILNASSLDSDKADFSEVQDAMKSSINEKLLDEEPSYGHSYDVWISFAEIYNEHVFDLLQHKSFNGKPKEKLKIGSSDRCIHIKNLTCVNVSSALEAFQIFQFGLKNLNYAKTQIHDHSSRSHSIFTIKLLQYGKDMAQVHASSLNFCDLAGSERSKKTMNIGERLKESNNINTSLFVLGRCLAGVRNAQKLTDFRQIPFRDSKLTLLFQNALLGQEDTTMIVNVNPSRMFFDETQHVLNFSAIAKEIEVIEQRPRVNLEISADEKEISENEENSNSSNGGTETKSILQGSSQSNENTEKNNEQQVDMVHQMTKKEYSQCSLDDFVEKCSSEDCMNHLRGKVLIQRYIIAEHHKTISTLQKEIFETKFSYQRKLEKLENEIKAQNEQIVRLKNQLEELEERNKNCSS